MNQAQFQRAFAIARNQNISLDEVDDSTLHGCGLPNFKPVTVTIQAAAKMIRWQTTQLNGGVDEEELNNLANIFRHRVSVVEEGQ